MAGVVRLWIDWEVQILVLVSFVLQVFLLMFAGMRRRNISPVSRTLLWLAYLLADSIAIYVPGHMSYSSQSQEHPLLLAFCAPLLLVHLGGQDTITAYSIEDNQLWRRHLLSLVLQALAVGYLLLKYIAGRWTLVTAAELIFVAGVLKYGERVWALKSSNLDSISNFLNNVVKPRLLREVQRGQDGPYSPRLERVEEEGLGSEEVLQGAHDLFPICMGQFVDYKFWPSPFQCKAIKLFTDKGCMYELIEMQLSLMYDILYTKAAVIHTWCGFFIRAVSSVATVTSFFLLQSSISKNDFNKVDAVVTYILLGGALLLEMAAVLMAMGSTWMCSLLRARRWDRLHNIVVFVRRCVKAAERRRWSCSIGQHKWLYLPDGTGPDSRGRETAWFFGCEDLWKKQDTMISRVTKKLVLEEIVRMAEACEGKEDIMRSYSGQCVLEQWHGFFEDLNSSTPIGFDEKILTWHYATEMFISSSVHARQQHTVVEAIGAVSKYMIFLLVELPYMMPSPVRPGLFANAQLEFTSSTLKQIIDHIKGGYDHYEIPPALVRGSELAERLLDKERDTPEVLNAVLGVWVEMLCYAAHHCNRDSHARQLNCGGEFITIVWLLTTAIFNHSYCNEQWFKDGAEKFFTPRQVA